MSTEAGGPTSEGVGQPSADQLELAYWLFGQLMRLGVIPRSTCEACNDVLARYGLEPKEVGPLTVPTTAWTPRSTSQAD